jgi:hypothetical protein
VLRLAKAVMEESPGLIKGIIFDESMMLLSRGKLCRENPMSARGAK